MIAWSIDGHHIRTFDGVVYTFNGIGEFSLIENDNIKIQIRTQETFYHAGVTDIAGFAVSFNNITVRVKFVFCTYNSISLFIHFFKG